MFVLLPDREGSAGMQKKRGGAAGGMARRRPNLDEADEEAYAPRKQEVDPTYSDPLGPQMERPKTAAKRHNMDDEFADEELGDDLLPE